MKLVANKAVGSKKIVARKAQALVSNEDFARAFKATPVGSVGDDTNPFSLWQLGIELEKRLASKGGRPALKGADGKLKVSLLNEDLPKIRDISEAVSADKYKPSPSQIAAILVHMALAHFSQEEIRRSMQGGR